MDDTERWHRLKRKLVVLLGPEDAETLMAPHTPPGWPDLATKDDLAALRTELRGEMAHLRAELHADMDALRTELRGEMAELRGEMAELRGEMAELRGEVHGELGKLRAEMAGQVRTHVLVTVTAVAATGSLAFAAASVL